MAKNIQLTAKGLNTDLNEEFQPDNTYRFLLNGNFESLSGEKGGVISERGNRFILGLPTNIVDYSIVGDCLLPDQDKVIFIAGKDLNGNKIQIVALHKRNNTYQELIRTSCLSYEKCDQIDCTFKVHNGCDIIIYFTDHRTKYKSINITNILDSTGRYEKNDPANPHIPAAPVSPGDNPANYPDGAGDYGWNCDLFLLSLISKHPKLYFHSQTNNGNLRVGTYTFFIRLLDSDLNPTDWLVWTNPITVKQGEFLFNSPPDNNDGAYTPSADFEKKINRSISLVINDLDPSLEYYEIGVAERTINTNTINRTYRCGLRLIPTSGNDVFLFNNVDDIRFTDIDLSSLLVANRKVDVVQAHAQINNRLVLANVQGSVRDWSKFQQASNDIKVEYFTYNTVDIEDACGPKTHFVSTGKRALDAEISKGFINPEAEGVNYSSPEFLSYGMSLMRDEVYALGIIYVFANGSESPVFHIPGRPKFDTVNRTWDVDGEITVNSYTINGYGSVNSFDYAEYATTEIVSFSADPDSAWGVGNPKDVIGGAVKQTFNGPFDNQQLEVQSHTRWGSWDSNRLTNLLQNGDNVSSNTANDEYKYLYGFKDFITCCYDVPFKNNSCNDSGANLERWQYYNTAIRRKDEETWNDPDRTFEVSGLNPAYTFSGGYMGIPGYFDTGIQYPDVVDCDGFRIFPQGPVRHHRMPDHRIEQIYDKQGDLGLSDIITDPVSLASTRAEWAAQSNINGDGGFRPGAANGWEMNDSEATLKLYPMGLRLSNVVPPAEFADEVVGYYVVRSDRTGNKTVVDKGFMNVCDTGITAKEGGIGYTAVDDFSALGENKIYTGDFSLIPLSQPDSQDNPWSSYRTAGTFKIPQHTWWNILEVHSPKGTYNDPVALSVDFLKLEATFFGDVFFDSGGPLAWDNGGIGDPCGTGSDPTGITCPGESYIQRFDTGGIWYTNPTGNSQFEQLGWNTGFSIFMNRHKYPRMQNPTADDWWSFVYNIPISGSAYVGYNALVSTSELGGGFTEIDNTRYKQPTLLMKYGQSCNAVDGTAFDDDNAVLTTAPYSMCIMNMPQNYWMLKRDIARGDLNRFMKSTSGVRNLDVFMNADIRDPLYKSYTSNGDAWAHESCVTQDTKWSVPYSPYMYYVAMKSAITPYEDFDGISYIKMHSYMIPIDNTQFDPYQFGVTGGDTFINRFQFEKGFWLINYPALPDPNFPAYRQAINTTTAGPTKELTPSGPQYGEDYAPSDADIGGGPEGQTNLFPKFGTTLTVGYVESEINTAFRHLQQGDNYRSFPFNDRSSYYNYLYQANLGPGGTGRGELNNYMSSQQISYRYRIDYSSYNSDIPSYALGSTYDYCSDCAESYPNTLIYSEISLDSQVEDFYKIFLTNSVKSVPNNTGEITNMFVKNSDLYIHTEHNLWKISVAPQEMQTTGATISVGQSGFLERAPVKLFNNDDAYSRGGCIDKFSSRFANGQFTWLDRNSSSVFSLGNEMKVISDVGLMRHFANKSELQMDLQFLSLTGSVYPLNGTACEFNVGYKSVYDPEHERYILTKKDYKLVPEVFDNIVEITLDPDDSSTYLPAISTDTYYYNRDGFYIGIGDGDQVADKDLLLSRLDFTDKEVAENHSWTLSYSLRDQVWCSFHSYIPNWTYNDSYTFYSYINNPEEGVNQKVWEHNYGEFQTYYDVKQDFIIDYVYKKQPYGDKTFDTLEYTSNVWLEETVDGRWIEVPFTTFDRFYVYNNTQVSNQKEVSVSNNTPYASVNYDVNQATAHKWRNTWKINRLRDMSIGRLNLSEPKFTTDWNQTDYQDQFENGYGYIDKIINPDIIDLTKNIYQIERFTEKFLNVRLFFKPLEDYKITIKVITGQKRDRI